MKIHDIMKPVAVVPPETTLAEAEKLMKKNSLPIIPIGTRDDVKGVVTPSEIGKSAGQDGTNPDAMPVEDVAVPVIPFCDEEQEAEDVLERMRANREKSLLVRNGSGEFVGSISLKDLSKTSRAA